MKTARLDRPRPIEQWTAQQLGVHAAIHGTDAPDTGGAYVLPRYIEREHDHRLRSHLLNTARSQQAALVLVRGVSCSGKTRTALEAVRICLPRWNLVFPKTAEGLLALLDVGGPAPRTVLWLDEVQNHLRGTAGEEAAAALGGLLEEPGPVLVLGTLWPEYFRGFASTPRPAEVTREDEHRNARALLAQAVLVDVPASFTSESLEDPLVNRDPSLAAAARWSTGGRIVQTLAAGPQLVDHYQQATEPHGPYGHAVITAAMDARRLGHASPLPAALLEAAAPGYLTEQQRADADPDTWFGHALAYARERIKAVAAALEPVATPDGMGPAPGLFRLNDYLDHHARTTRHYALPPASFWTAVRDHADTSDLNAVARQAMSRLRSRIAADLYQRAAAGGDSEALTELARLRERMGDRAGAERFAQQAADAGRTDALCELAHKRESAGDVAGAERMFQRAAEGGDRQALSRLAWQRRRSGDTAGAELVWQRAAEAGHVFALPELGRLREQVGDAAGAVLAWQQVADTGDPSALVALGRLHWAAGDVAGAERMFQQAADAGLLYALRDWGTLRAQAGDVAGAVLVYQRAADAGDPVALRALGARYEAAGDAAGAEQFWRRAADAGFVEALLEMVSRRRAAGDVPGAERYAQRAADAGVPSALRELGQLCWAYGDTAAAERLFQRAAEARDKEALAQLMLLREEGGDAAGAERLARRSADAGDHSLLRELAIHRDVPWNAAGAEPLWQQIADAGDRSALVALGRLRKRAGDTEGAERLWQLAADAGDVEALSELGRQRGQADGMSVVEQVRRFGLEADGSPASPW
ncbi:tetratricopeptide repeat protein [Streptomyces sp. NPDC058525]|uniref:tetratricopeptide repeat protein n=1 Tax=Streptomyces sp. NPDC058525 TaxID=3346538 RepID=UPI00365534EF